MPGSTYAIGFVRTYADHLGLDGVALVNQFKREAAGIDRRTTLTFPSPAPDGRVPGFWPLSIAVLALLAIAGGWYVLRGDLAPLPPRVASVPERLAPPPPSPPPPAPQPETASAAAASEAPPPAAPVPTAGEPQPSQTASLSAPSGSLSALPETPRAASPALDATPPAAAPPAPAAPPPPAPVQAQTEPEASPPSATALLAAPPPKPEPVQPTVPAASAVPSDGRVFGAQNENARIVIQAHGESWIQVRDAANNAVLSRVLRAGDSYRVPNQPGLTMMTGNAGNLDVIVDGNPAPSLGAVGLVKRNISLDPDRLRGGQ